jgi:hypothetical protein
MTCYGLVRAFLKLSLSRVDIRASLPFDTKTRRSGSRELFQSGTPGTILQQQSKKLV